jgi:DNA mismatch repair protein MutL
MQDIIRLLPESLANQIAAGEVVQRPASIVKELMENAVDAGASQITLLVKDAGKSLVQVVDNGKGMSPTDARMCFERHATSKISKTDDLFAIRTFGFRGEAMASIAAVAQVMLKTRVADEEVGTAILIEGSEVKSQEPVACTAGTSVSVQNLFFNVPARRNFLKSNPVEMKHIIDEFQRVSLAYPEIAMVLYHEDLEIYQLKEGNLAKRAIALFGKNYQQMLIPCQEATSIVSISGYIGKPETAKKTRGEQFFFVNNRYIRHPFLHHAIMTGYEGLLQEGTFPFYALNITIDPSRVDVNVHPTKTEVKFDDERALYGMVLAAVRQALASNGVAPSLDFEFDINYLNTSPRFTLPEQRSNPAANSSDSLPQTPFAPGKASNNLKYWESLYQDGSKQSDWPSYFSADAVPEQQQGETISMKFASAANDLGENKRDTERDKGDADKKLIQLKQKYILSLIRSGIMLIDQQAAHQRILYEKFEKNLYEGGGSTQQLLFPVQIPLNPADFALASEILDEMRSIGFDIEVFGTHALLLRGLPAEIKGPVAEKEMIEQLLEQYKLSQPGLQVNHQQRLALLIAKKAAIKEGQILSQVEMQALIEQLFACTNPNYTPEGKKIVTLLNLEQIDALFAR